MKNHLLFTLILAAWLSPSLIPLLSSAAGPAVDLTAPDVKLVPLDFKMEGIDFTIMAPEGSVVKEGLDTSILRGDDFGFTIDFGKHAFLSSRNWWAQGGGFISHRQMLVDTSDLFLVETQEKGDNRFCIGTAVSVPKIDLFVTAMKKDAIGKDVQSRENCLLILKCARTIALKKEPPEDLSALLDWLKIEVRQKNPQGDVTAVTLPYRWTEAAIPVLLRMPELTSIWCKSLDVTAAGLKRLSGLKNLQELTFPAVTPVSADLLSAVSDFPNLVTFNSNSFFYVAKVDQSGLAGLQRLKKLENLNLENYNLNDAGVGTLGQLTTLKRLAIGCDSELKERGSKYRHAESDITDAGLTHLASLKNLESLYLPRLDITGAGFKSLGGLQDLQTLILRDTLLDDAGLSFVCQLHSLQTLDLTRTDVTDAGIKSLPLLKQLTTLDLSGTQITPAGLKSLASLPQLKALHLTGTQLTGEGFEVLANLPNLESLELDQSPIDDAGLSHFSSLAKLKFLSLDKTRITDAGVDEAGGSEKSASGFNRTDRSDLQRHGLVRAGPRRKVGYHRLPVGFSVLLFSGH